MIKIIEGNIFDYIRKDIILVHQCNCQGAMGRGIAKTIRDKFSKYIHEI